MARPTLFLIDGSSQMYRAYHAFRGQGLSNQEGQTTHAVYVFVTMLRKLIERSPARATSPRRSIWPGRRSATSIVADYKANRAAMPDDLAEQINWVHQACEALGVPIVTAAGYEADDVIGTMATRAADGGFEVAIVSIDKDFFQLVRDGIRVYDPREDGAWFDAAGRRREVRRRAVAGRRRAGARRRHQRQRGRRARHRQEGRDRSDHAVTAASTRCSSSAGELKPKQREALIDASRRGAAEPRARHHPHATCRSTSTSSRCATAAPRASAATSCSRGWRSARWSTSTRRPRTRSRRTTRSVTTLDGARRADRRAARRRRVRACA